ncbi:hypothetical protein E2C01_036341 [Portunus trituberculatus]|uniref:Uncharacterized protein n=1 Tax=Portunus trituberculatus TaxID=210409 RepID=A0A5B7FC72_PORTR|nr:hypothetical protein [Portunus trituberculatus]
MERISFSRRAWEGKKGERVKEGGGDVLCQKILDFASKAEWRAAQSTAGLAPGTASTVSCAVAQKK